MMFNHEQLEALAELFLDIAKGAFLATFAILIFTQNGLIEVIKSFLAGVFCTFASLKFISLKGENR